MRRYIVNRSLDDAVAIRERFVDRPAKKTIDIHWQWPRELQEVGVCEAIMYTSDKWQRSGEYQDYKHVAEGPQRLLVQKGFLVDYNAPSRPLSVVGPWCDITNPPAKFAELAPILGIQIQLYVRDGQGYRPSGEYQQVNIARAKLGAAVHPDTGETFLLIYTPRDLHAIITGDELAVERDGIVG